MYHNIDLMKVPLNLGITKRVAIRSIPEVYFGNNAKSEVYANLSTDIPELAEIPHATLRII